MYALYSFSIAAFIGVFYYNYYNKEDKFDREYHPFGIAIAAIDVHLMILKMQMEKRQKAFISYIKENFNLYDDSKMIIQK